MFKVIKKEVDNKFKQMAKNNLFIVELDRNELYNAYSAALPEEERQPHNCNCCKSFLRQYGGIVNIIDNKIVTMWDFETEAPYDKVPKALHDIVVKAAIRTVFVNKDRHLGTDYNFQQPKEDETEVIKWKHFSAELPKDCLYDRSESISEFAGKFNTNKQVLKRALEEITIDAAETILELINQNSLYKGEEYKGIVESFVNFKKEYDKILNLKEKDLYVWSNTQYAPRIRNTAIGTLLVNLSEGKDLDYAVSAFETIVAPQNYKRPKALVTKLLVKMAEKDIKELGYERSLYRRFAITDDIPVSVLKFVDRDLPEQSLFDEMKSEVKVDVKTFSKVEEVPIDTFIKDIIPTATSIELLLENKHDSNLMSLIAPEFEDAPSMFNWDSAISWCYKNGLTDSIKERVKRAGGSITGELRVSLDWFNYDDLDLSVIEPSGYKIYHGVKENTITKGILDVDMNVDSNGSRKAVENITWPNSKYMDEGTYSIVVHNYNHREKTDIGFNIEIECQGQVLNFNHAQMVKHREQVLTAKINYERKTGMTLVSGNVSNSSNSSKDIWGLNTNNFHKVSMIMESPNYWEDRPTGNRHTFFIIDEAYNNELTRGMFNEFLKPELAKHKRTFEVLANKLKVKESHEQLSGVGFSSTQRNEVIVKVKGKFERVVKVKF